MTSSRCKATWKWPLLAASLPLSFCASVVQAQEGGRWSSGALLYEKVCGHCHKPEVGVGTLLEGRELPPEYVTYIVRNGLNAMPAFPASFIDDESIRLVAEYLASLQTQAIQP
ncbi:MAG: cytochrome c [Gammaproteobacteria bacterium]|nr:4-cresol dehydrogenase [Gammaproteobacteria bacterium]